MEKSDKELLIKDLLMRVQHNVKVEISFTGFNSVSRLELYHIQQLFTENGIKIKPYLRPMESIKKEERAEMGEVIHSHRGNPYGKINYEGVDNLLLASIRMCNALTDWLLKNNFDFHGLIEKDLAIPITEENNPYK